MSVINGSPVRPRQVKSLHFGLSQSCHICQTYLLGGGFLGSGMTPEEKTLTRLVETDKGGGENHRGSPFGDRIDSTNHRIERFA